MGYPTCPPPYYSTFTTITPPSSNPYTPFASFPHPYSQFQPPPPSSPPLPYSQPQPPPLYSGYYNNIHPYSQHVGASQNSEMAFSNELTLMASQPVRELLVAMQESVREIRDSLLALRDKIREKERLSALTDEMRPKERFPRLEGSAVVNSPEAVEDATEKALFNSIDNTISDSSSFSQSSPVSGTKPPKLDVLPAQAGIEAISSQARWKSIRITMGEEKSDNPAPKPPRLKPPESDLFTGSNGSLLVLSARLRAGRSRFHHSSHREATHTRRCRRNHPTQLSSGRLWTPRLRRNPEGVRTNPPCLYRLRNLRTHMAFNKRSNPVQPLQHPLYTVGSFHFERCSYEPICVVERQHSPRHPNSSHKC